MFLGLSFFFAEAQNKLVSCILVSLPKLRSQKPIDKSTVVSFNYSKLLLCVSVLVLICLFLLCHCFWSTFRIVGINLHVPGLYIYLEFFSDFYWWLLIILNSPPFSFCSQKSIFLIFFLPNFIPILSFAYLAFI